MFRKKVQIPGVLPGGGMVTAGIDRCISLSHDGEYPPFLGYLHLS